MFKFWLQKVSGAQLKLLESVEQACVDDGLVVYAIGDIHGMADLLNSLLQKIQVDRHTHTEKAILIFLGDMIDRGSESCQILETIHQLFQKTENQFSTIALLGNHERMFNDFLADPEKSGSLWLRHGGDATLRSFGVHPPHDASPKQLRFVRDELKERLTISQIEWLKKLPSQFTIGDYFFCHASINSEKPLSKQSDEDLLWSRRFPSDQSGPQEKIIVHGHQPVSDPTIAKFHINVDTGAYASGRLTALKLFGNTRTFITAQKLLHK